MLEAGCSSDVLVPTYQNTWCHNWGDHSVNVEFEVITVLIMKNIVWWVVTLQSSGSLPGFLQNISRLLPEYTALRTVLIFTTESFKPYIIINYVFIPFIIQSPEVMLQNNMESRGNTLCLSLSSLLYLSSWPWMMVAMVIQSIGWVCAERTWHGLASSFHMMPACSAIWAFRNVTSGPALLCAPS